MHSDGWDGRNRGAGAHERGSGAPRSARQGRHQGRRNYGHVELREVDAQTAGAHDMKLMTGTKGVEVTVTVTGLKPGAHGLHLHAVGKCEAPDFTSAGGHFDPGPNGEPDPDTNHPFHMGDLPEPRRRRERPRDAEGGHHARDASATGRSRSSTPTARPSSFTAIRTRAITGEAKSGVSGGPRVACGVVTKQ